MVTEVVEVEVTPWLWRSWGCPAWRTSSARRGRGSPWWPPPPATPHPSTSTWAAASTPPASTPSPSEYQLEDNFILDNRIFFLTTSICNFEKCSTTSWGKWTVNTCNLDVTFPGRQKVSFRTNLDWSLHYIIFLWLVHRFYNFLVSSWTVSGISYSIALLCY